MPRSRIVLHTLLVLAALFVGMAIAAVALLILAAGGHGWNGAMFSAVALITAPSGAAAWMMRGSPVGRWMAIATVIVNLAADLLFLIFSSREGWDYITQAWEHIPAVIVIWAVAWICTQTVPLLALSALHFSRQSDRVA